MEFRCRYDVDLEPREPKFGNQCGLSQIDAIRASDILRGRLYVNPGVAFQFDPSAFLPYGHVTLTKRGAEYSFDEMDDVYGPSQTIRFNMAGTSSFVEILNKSL
jgi:hypothetical protein